MIYRKKDILGIIKRLFGEDCLYDGTAKKYVDDVATGEENKVNRRRLKQAFESGAIVKLKGSGDVNEALSALENFTDWKQEVACEVINAFCDVFGKTGIKVCSKPQETVSASPDSDTQYKVGEKGPAGGWVFYDKGYFSDGWRYLEAAPSDAPNTYTWADDGNFGTKEGMGTGSYNTKKLAGKSKDRPVNAIEYCIHYSCNGFSDWFLPSSDELNQMHNVLHKNNLGNFADDYYWSSSEDDDDNVWSQDFYSGDQDNYCGRDSNSYVRPVRAF